jgi:hypothetical protein
MRSRRADRVDAPNDVGYQGLGAIAFALAAAIPSDHVGVTLVDAAHAHLRICKWLIQIQS